jgi:hypothetical protein
LPRRIEGLPPLLPLVGDGNYLPAARGINSVLFLQDCLAA